MFVSAGCGTSLKANSAVSPFKGAGCCCWVEAEICLYVQQCQDRRLFKVLPGKVFPQTAILPL